MNFFEVFSFILLIFILCMVSKTRIIYVYNREHHFGTIIEKELVNLSLKFQAGRLRVHTVTPKLKKYYLKYKNSYSLRLKMSCFNNTCLKKEKLYIALRSYYKIIFH